MSDSNNPRNIHAVLTTQDKFPDVFLHEFKTVMAGNTLYRRAYKNLLAYIHARGLPIRERGFPLFFRVSLTFDNGSVFWTGVGSLDPERNNSDNKTSECLLIRNNYLSGVLPPTLVEDYLVAIDTLSAESFLPPPEGQAYLSSRAVDSPANVVTTVLNAQDFYGGGDKPSYAHTAAVALNIMAHRHGMRIPSGLRGPSLRTTSVSPWGNIVLSHDILRNSWVMDGPGGALPVNIAKYGPFPILQSKHFVEENLSEYLSHVGAGLDVPKKALWTPEVKALWVRELLARSANMERT